MFILYNEESNRGSVKQCGSLQKNVHYVYLLMVAREAPREYRMDYKEALGFKGSSNLRCNTWVRYTTDCVASLLPFVPSFFSLLFSRLKQGKSPLRAIEKLLWCSYNSCASISRIYPVFFFFFFFLSFFFINPPASRSKRREGMKTGWYLVRGVWIHEILIFSSDWYRQNATAW